MASTRKDNKGRVLRKGESFRKKSGQYQFAYQDESGKRQYIYSKDLITLRQREDDIRRDQLDGINSRQAKDLTLNEMFDRYMATRTDLAPRTYAGYETLFDCHVRERIGKRKLKDIRHSDVILAFLNLEKEKQLSLGTIERIYRVIYPAFEMAVRDCIIRINPSKDALKQFKQKTGAKRGIRKALTPEEQKAFLNFMDEHPVYDHWKSVYTFLIGTGLRVGELGGLTWKDIDLEKGMIRVDHALVYFSGKRNKDQKRYYMAKPKTEAGIRSVPIVKEVREALEENKRYLQENGIISTCEIDGYRDFVFLNRFGRNFIYADLDRALKRIIDAYNDQAIHEAAKKKTEPLILPQFTCHSLRHTFCARLCEHESNLKVIQDIMGHVDIGTTMNIYAEVSETKKKAAMEVMAEKMALF